MWRRPNSWKPGESIRALCRAGSIQYQWVAVVVCRPVLSAWEISPTWALASATSRLTSVLLPAPLGPRTSVARSASSGASRSRAGPRLLLQGDADHLDADRRVGREPRRGRRPGRQVLLVEDDPARNLRRLRGDQGPRQLRFAEHRLGGDDDEQLVDVGGEGLGLPRVLAIEKVVPRQHLLDHAFVAAGLPADPVADDGFALLAAGVAESAAAVVGLDDDVPAVPRDDPPFEVSRRRRRGHRPWRRR